jgi:enamine deaminase RidA (YjgF/YER057c/UK114 family)
MMTNAFNRRRFIESCGCAAAGAATGLLLPSWLESSRRAAADEKGPPNSAESQLRKLGIELPATLPPQNTYVPSVLVGELLFVAGHGPRKPDGSPFLGKVGRDLDLKQGQYAARLAGLRILSVVREALGSLDRVERVVKTLGMVNATPDFTQQPLVINGCSDLMVEIFGETAGKGARSAVGMGSLPGGIPVEIEMIFQVRG